MENATGKIRQICKLSHVKVIRVKIEKRQESSAYKLCFCEHIISIIAWQSFESRKVSSE